MCLFLGGNQARLLITLNEMKEIHSRRENGGLGKAAGTVNISTINTLIKDFWQHEGSSSQYSISFRRSSTFYCGRSDVIGRHIGEEGDEERNETEKKDTRDRQEGRKEEIDLAVTFWSILIRTISCFWQQYQRGLSPCVAAYFLIKYVGLCGSTHEIFCANSPDNWLETNCAGSEILAKSSLRAAPRDIC